MSKEDQKALAAVDTESVETDIIQKIRIKTIDRASKKLKTAFGMVCVIAVVLMIAAMLLQMYSSLDILFEISTGQRILDSGIFYTNPITIDSDLDIVIQQWLFDVIVTLVYGFGKPWLILLSIAGFALLAVSGCIYLRQHGISIYVSFMLSLLLCFLFSGVIAQIRPECITLILLLLECMALEQYKEHPVWLCVLPVGMFLEANLHASMIWFHFAVAAAYLVPSVIPRWVKNNYLWRDKRIWAGVLSMIPAMFVNPYGIDGVMYLFDSMCADTFHYVDLYSITTEETDSLFMFPLGMMLAAVTVIGTSYLFSKMCLRSEQLYMVCGFVLCALSMARNYMFLYLALILLLPDLYKITVERLKGKMVISDIIIMVSAPICSVILIFISLINVVPAVRSYLNETEVSDISYACNMPGLFEEEFFLECDSYIQEHIGTDAKIFAGPTNSTVLEYLGYSNLLLDCRPELYMSAINGSRDILAEYVYLCCRYVPDEYDYGEDTAVAIRDYLDSYGFDYLLILDGYEELLQDYLGYAGEDSGYGLVMESGWFRLYEKIK